MKFTQDDFDAWWGSSVGHEVRRVLAKNIEELHEATFSEAVVRDPIKGAILLGQKQALTEFLNLSHGRLIGSE